MVEKPECNLCAKQPPFPQKHLLQIKMIWSEKEPNVLVLRFETWSSHLLYKLVTTDQLVT